MKNDEQVCGTCKYHKNVKDTSDWKCINAQSENCECYTLYDGYCEDWESKDEGGQINER